MTLNSKNLRENLKLVYSKKKNSFKREQKIDLIVTGSNARVGKEEQTVNSVSTRRPDPGDGSISEEILQHVLTREGGLHRPARPPTEQRLHTAGGGNQAGCTFTA